MMMRISEVKHKLNDIEELNFKLPDGRKVPAHFHVTEIGVVTRKFIDCGGTLREEEGISFQLFEANDFDHRLPPKKLLSIIEMAQDKLKFGDLEVEVEYQGDTIGKYSLDFSGKNFLLLNKYTDCLAKDKCGIPAEKPKLKLSEIRASRNSCAPGTGCC